MVDAISTEARIVCACCNVREVCRMYVLQSGHTAWVCEKCRKGETNGASEVAFLKKYGSTEPEK